MGPLSPGCSPGPSTSACPQLISSCLSSPCGLPVPMSNITRHPTAHTKNVGDILNLALPHCPPPVPRPLPLRCPSEQLSNPSALKSRVSRYNRDQGPSRLARTSNLYSHLHTGVHASTSLLHILCTETRGISQKHRMDHRLNILCCCFSRCPQD